MIPWGQIISTSVSLADIAHSLYKTTKKTSQEETKGGKETKDEYQQLIDKIAKLELMQVDQAQVIQQLAEQNKTLTRKTRTAYMLAIVATLLALLLSVTWLFII